MRRTASTGHLHPRPHGIDSGPLNTFVHHGKATNAESHVSPLGERPRDGAGIRSSHRTRLRSTPLGRRLSAAGSGLTHARLARQRRHQSAHQKESSSRLHASSRHAWSPRQRSLLQPLDKGATVPTQRSRPAHSISLDSLPRSSAPHSSERHPAQSSTTARHSASRKMSDSAATPPHKLDHEAEVVVARGLVMRPLSAHRASRPPSASRPRSAQARAKDVNSSAAHESPRARAGSGMSRPTQRPPNVVAASPAPSAVARRRRASTSVIELGRLRPGNQAQQSHVNPTRTHRQRPLSARRAPRDDPLHCASTNRGTKALGQQARATIGAKVPTVMLDPKFQPIRHLLNEWSACECWPLISLGCNNRRYAWCVCV